MIIYLFKSILCLLVLWVFYKVALEPLAAHRLKRFYLLGSLLFSLTLPLLTITYQVEVEPQPVQQDFSSFALSENILASTKTEEKTDSLPYIIFSIYGFGVLFFGFRFARNLYRINYKVRSSEKRQCADHTKVLLEQQTVPHSFLRFIFLPKTDFINQKIAPEILEHERAHVIQKHTWDILAVEFLQVLFWFNPFLFWFKKSVALNHEFLADQQALRQNTDPAEYTQLLFQYSGGAHHTALSSPINYSLTRTPYRRAKKRIIMLSQTFSAKKLATRLAFLLPVLALCVYFFTQDMVAKPVYNSSNTTLITKRQKWIQVYVEKDKSIVVEGQKTDLKRLTATLTDLTHYTQKERKENLKLMLYVDPRISLDFIDKISNRIREYGIYSMIEKTIMKPIKNHPDYDKMKINYNRALKLSVKNQFKIYGYVITFDLVGKGLSNEQTQKELEKSLTILIKETAISVNDKPTTLKGFIETVNQITKDWTKEDMWGYSIHLRYENGVDKFLGKLADEFHKTKLYKTNPSKELISPPPPPAPKPPKVGEVAPPPPPAPKFFDQNFRKHLMLKIENENLTVNGISTSIDNFKNTVDQITKDWTEQEIKNFFGVELEKFDGSIDPYLQKIKIEFKKTQLYRSSPYKEKLFPHSEKFRINFLRRIKQADDKSSEEEVQSLKTPISELKNFKIIIEKSKDKIILHGTVGTAWKELTFTIDENVGQPVDAWGMTNLNPKNKDKDPKLADFLITVARTKKGIVLQGIKGTTWINLSFSLLEGQKKSINQFGT